MKRTAYLILAAAATLICTSCEKVEEAENQHTIEKYQGETGSMSFNLGLLKGDKADSYKLIIYSPGTKAYTSIFSAHSSWKITSIPDWLTVEPTEGKPSLESISITCTAQENKTGQPRYGTMYLEANNKRYTIDIIQDDPTFNPETPMEGVLFRGMDHWYAYRYRCFIKSWGGENDLSLISPYDWRITSIPDWVTIEPKSGTGSQERVWITIFAPSNSGPYRAGLAKLEVGDMTLELEVHQYGSDY